MPHQGCCVDRPASNVATEAARRWNCVLDLRCAPYVPADPGVGRSEGLRGLSGESCVGRVLHSSGQPSRLLGGAGRMKDHCKHFWSRFFFFLVFFFFFFLHVPEGPAVPGDVAMMPTCPCGRRARRYRSRPPDVAPVTQIGNTAPIAPRGSCAGQQGDLKRPLEPEWDPRAACFERNAAPPGEHQDQPV